MKSNTDEPGCQTLSLLAVTPYNAIDKQSKSEYKVIRHVYYV
jgi:hypothetical protein